MISIVRTADWHVGRVFAQLESDDPAALFEARFAVVERMAGIATSRGVDAILVAGDVFNAQTVIERTIRRLFNSMQGFTGTWMLIPGSHDAALAESVWTRAQRMGAIPGNVIVCLESKPVASDRLCLCVLLRGVTAEQLIELKTSLWTQGVAFNDGYPFQRAEFSPATLAVDPIKDNLWSIKFVPGEQELAATINACAGSIVEVYNFYGESPLDSTLVPKSRELHAINGDSAYLLQEAMEA